MDGLRWYARNGDEITMEQAMALVQDRDYQVVEQTQVGPYWISTVWLFGHDLSFMAEGDDPILFETMVFAHDSESPSPLGEDGLLGPDIEQRRWRTEDEAKQGHAEIVLLVQATLQEEPRS